MVWSPHEAAVLPEMHELAILKANVVVKRSILIMEWMEYLHSIGSIQTGEWHREGGIQGNSVEGMATFHKAGPGILTVLQDEI